MKRVSSAAFLAITSIGACVPTPNEPPGSSLQNALDANRTKWEATGPDSYTYRFANACECLPETTGPILIVVEDGQVTSVLRPEDAAGLPSVYTGPRPTIPHLFDTVQAAIEMAAPSIVVTYDEQWGYPTQIYIDWDTVTADEETSHTAGELVSSSSRTELDANRSRWTSHRITFYEYEFQNSCFCGPEVTQPTILSVENGEVVALRNADTGATLEPRENGSYPTIEELFDTVLAGLEGADSVVAEYDEERGFPTSIYVDWNAGTADEETSYSAKNLVILFQAELDANRTKWSAAAIDTYEYHFGNFCLCPPTIVGPTIIAVEGGRVTQLRSADGVPFEPQEDVRYPTIEDLFDDVQSAIDRGLGMDSLSVRYDDQWGFPSELFVDWVAELADEETSYSASNLTIP